MADPAPALQLDSDNPWPGLDSYTELAQKFFFGRDQDSADLLRLIRLSPYVVLYGKSGLGKSSMLQAGVFPRLRDAHYLPVHLRLDYREGAPPPLDQAQARLHQEIAAAGADAPPPAAGEGLWAYLQRRERPIWSADNFPLTPVLVFDQFEEVFSRGGSPAHVKAMLDPVADLVGDRLPDAVAGDREAMRRLNLEGPQYRVVLSFRSDFLAEIESWEHDANLPKRESHHLRAMTRETAIDAVRRAGAAVLEPGVETKIVDFVLGRDGSTPGTATEVEPALLSLCCYQLNSRRQRPARIDGALLDSVGEDILLDFYREALAGSAPRVSVFIEDNLIQGGRYRSSFPRDEAIASGALTEDELTQLMARRLLRVDPQGGVPRIELIHDRLVGIVRDAREARRLREQQAREREQHEKQLAEQARDRAEQARVQQLQQSRRRLFVLTGVMGFALLYLLGLGWVAWSQRDAAQASAARASALLLGLQAQGMLNGTEAGGDARAFQQLLVARSLWPSDKQSVPLFKAVASRAHLRAFEPVVVAEEKAALALAFAPRGQPALLVAGHADGSVSLRDPEHPQAVSARAAGHGEAILALAISPDGQRLVSAGADGTLRRWRLQPLAPEGEALRGHEGAVTGVRFSADGRRIVSGGVDGTVRLWNADSGAVLAASTPLPFVAIQAVDFRSDPVLPAIAALTSTSPATGISSLLLLDPENLSLLNSPQYAHTQDGLALAASPSGEFIATGGEDDTLRVRNWASATGRGGLQASMLRMEGGGNVTSVAFSPNGHWLAAGNEFGELRLWQASGGAPVGLPLSGLQGAVSGLAFSPDGRWLAASGPDGLLEMWPLDADWSAGGSAQKRPPDGTSSMALARDGDLALYGLPDGSLVLRTEGQPDRRLEDPREPDAGDKPLIDCQVGATHPARGGAYAYAPRLRQRAAGTAGEREVQAVAVSGDGRSAVSAHADGTLRRWDLAGGQPVGPALRISNCALEAVALSGDGRRIAVANRELAVLLLDAAGRLLMTVQPDARPSVRRAPDQRQKPGPRDAALALSADGNTLAVAGRGGSLMVYTEGAGRPARVASIAGAVEPLASLAFSPDGAFLAGGNGYGGVRLWELATGSSLGPPQTLGAGPLRAVAFSGDGKRLHSMDSRGDRRDWPAPGTWVGLMCNKVGANLSRKDWAEWVSPDIAYRCPCPGLPIAPDDPASRSSPETCGAAR